MAEIILPPGQHSLNRIPPSDPSLVKYPPDIEFTDIPAGPLRRRLLSITNAVTFGGLIALGISIAVPEFRTHGNILASLATPILGLLVHEATAKIGRQQYADFDPETVANEDAQKLLGKRGKGAVISSDRVNRIKAVEDLLKSSREK